MTRKLKDISIVPAQPADREPVVALLAAQMAEHRTRSQNAKLSRMYEQILADERYGFLLVGKAGCEIVGVAYVATILSIEHGARVGWLEELYVRPEHRDIGIGSSLLTSTIKLAHKMGLSALDLEVDVEHRRVESLYQRFGFRRLPRSRWVKSRLTGRGARP
jgi:GNAT superfamily N-acetyltransferase